MLKLSLVCSSLGMDAHPKRTEIWKAHLSHGILSLCDCLFTKTSRAHYAPCITSAGSVSNFVTVECLREIKFLYSSSEVQVLH